MKRIRIGYTFLLLLVLAMAIFAREFADVKWYGSIECIWLFIIYEIICNVIFLTAKKYDKEIVKQALRAKDIDSIRTMCNKTVAWDGLIKNIDESIDEEEFDKMFLTELKGYLNSIIRNKKTKAMASCVVSIMLVANIWRDLRFSGISHTEVYYYMSLVMILIVILYEVLVKRYFTILNKKRATLNRKINML